jgi:hypothetical protein
VLGAGLNVRVCLFSFFIIFRWSGSHGFVTPVGLATGPSGLTLSLSSLSLLKYWQTLEGVWWFSYHFFVCVCLSLIFSISLHNKSSRESEWLVLSLVSVWPTFLFSNFIGQEREKKLQSREGPINFRRLLDLWDLFWQIRFTYRNDFILRLECQINVGDPPSILFSVDQHATIWLLRLRTFESGSKEDFKSVGGFGVGSHQPGVKKKRERKCGSKILWSTYRLTFFFVLAR